MTKAIPIIFIQSIIKELPLISCSKQSFRHKQPSLFSILVYYHGPVGFNIVFVVYLPVKVCTACCEGNICNLPMPWNKTDAIFTTTSPLSSTIGLSQSHTLTLSLTIGTFIFSSGVWKETKTHSNPLKYTEKWKAYELVSGPHDFYLLDYTLT